VKAGAIRIFPPHSYTTEKRAQHVQAKRSAHHLSAALLSERHNADANPVPNLILPVFNHSRLISEQNSSAFSNELNFLCFHPAVPLRG
jgi:hypothetical protein